VNGIIVIQNQNKVKNYRKTVIRSSWMAPTEFR